MRFRSCSLRNRFSVYNAKGLNQAATVRSERRNSCLAFEVDPKRQNISHKFSICFGRIRRLARRCFEYPNYRQSMQSFADRHVRGSERSGQFLQFESLPWNKEPHHHRLIQFAVNIVTVGNEDPLFQGGKPVLTGLRKPRHKRRSLAISSAMAMSDWSSFSGSFEPRALANRAACDFLRWST